MQTQELERIRRYADLRSLLEAVSVGLLLLGKGLFILTPSDVLKVPLVLCMVASWIAWACFAPLYYSRKYGEVERKRSWPWPRLVGVSVIVTLVFGSALVFSVGDARLSYILWGSLMVCTWIGSESRRSQAYYLALGVLLLALALPGPSSTFLPQALATKGVAYTLSGTALILAGLLDHLQLVRLLGPSATMSLEDLHDLAVVAERRSEEVVPLEPQAGGGGGTGYGRGR